MQSRAVNQYLGGARLLDAHAQGAHRAQSGQAVLAGEKSAHFAHALGDSAEHQRAVRDGFVAGHRQGAENAHHRMRYETRDQRTARGYEPSTLNNDARISIAVNACATGGSLTCPSTSIKNT